VLGLGCTGGVEVVSQSTTGVVGEAASHGTALSGDGRFVAFESEATLTAGLPPETLFDVYVRDVELHTTTLVSADHAEATNAIDPSISADGRWVAFTRLPTHDFEVAHVFVWDRLTGETRRVSETADGTPGDGNSSRAEVSADGRFVVFESFASNLVLGDSNGTEDVLVHDREAGTLERVSLTSSGAEAAGGAPAISGDGRFVSFASRATALGATTHGDLFVRDREIGTTERVAIGVDRQQPLWARFDASGRRLLYARFGWCVALPPLPGCTAPPHELWILDRDTDTHTPVALDVELPSGLAPQYGWSADGSRVAFATKLALAPEDTNASSDVYVAEPATGDFRLASASADGTPANAASGETAISADGAFLTFASSANNLAPLPVPTGLQQIYRKALATSEGAG
jgi:Tol biopolymer transport system component